MDQPGFTKWPPLGQAGDTGNKSGVTLSQPGDTGNKSGVTLSLLYFIRPYKLHHQVKVKSDVTLEDALTKALKLRDLTVTNCYAYNTLTR